MSECHYTELFNLIKVLCAKHSAESTLQVLTAEQTEDTVVYTGKAELSVASFVTDDSSSTDARGRYSFPA